MATKKAEKEMDEAALEQDDSPKMRYSTIMLQEQGAKYKTLLTEKYKNRVKWEKPDLRKIYSQIPGTVIKVYVEEGQKVNEGDLMMVLEAMKMKNKILFTQDGVVNKIYVSENEKIPKNHLMIELK
ncbi:MAG TPA: acetyl-CoA carboxylase biotin carboxyl carrier protein subunit [Bacteroidales bacterium]|nr:acetyl-CoA carboxylase biotin carboxyl carrier protein subunit [Bacteroidales bacterium]